MVVTVAMTSFPHECNIMSAPQPCYKQVKKYL